MEANPLEEQNKILGSRLSAERESSEKTLARAAEQLGVSAKVIKSFESARSTPSLPQLELLADLYRVPLERLLSSETPQQPGLTLAADRIANFLEIRNRIIAATLKQQRLSRKLSLKKLAAAVGISSGMLSKLESGKSAIPEPLLHALCSQLDLDIHSLISPLTAKAPEVHTPTRIETSPSTLPDELRDFIQNPANLPYLELAKRLSEMDAAKLRAIAEDLLEITY